MIKVIESNEAIEIQSQIPKVQRLLFVVLALFPLIAPYELVMRPKWQSYLNVPFLFAAALSTGALAVSAFLVWAAIAGLNSRLRFDRSAGTLAYTAGAPILRRRTVLCQIDSVDRLEVQRHDWSEGSPSYSLSAIMSDGRSFNSGSSWSQQEVEAIAKRVSSFLGK